MSTTLCLKRATPLVNEGTLVLKNVVDYYNVYTRDSLAFRSLLAFDCVNYWQLFNTLLDGNVPYNIRGCPALLLVFSPTS